MSNSAVARVLVLKNASKSTIGVNIGLRDELLIEILSRQVLVGLNLELASSVDPRVLHHQFECECRLFIIVQLLIGSAKQLIRLHNHAPIMRIERDILDDLEELLSLLEEANVEHEAAQESE